MVGIHRKSQKGHGKDPNKRNPSVEVKNFPESFPRTTRKAYGRDIKVRKFLSQPSAKERKNWQSSGID
jgi:hypothetical protein